MKTTEERAKEYAKNQLWGIALEDDEYEQRYNSIVEIYLEIAAEQQKIYDERIAELEKELSLYKGRVEIDDLVETENARKIYMLEAKLKGLIEESCEWLCQNVATYVDTQGCVDIYELEADFRKNAEK